LANHSLAALQSSPLWTLRHLGVHGGTIKTMHQAVSAGGHEPDVGTFALHGEEPSEPVPGKRAK
jgi:hypothetical protein